MEPETIHARLKKMRNNLGISQTELANKLGITPSYVSAMERGSKSITRKVVEKLIELYQVSADWLISGSETIGTSESDLPILKGLTYQPDKISEKGRKNSQNNSYKIASPSDLAAAEADKIRNTVQAAAIGGDGARRWADRRFMEARIYKRFPAASSDTLNDYFLTSQLGQYIDQMLVELHNTLHYRIDLVLDQAIANELTMQQAAEKIQEITRPLNRLQAKLEAMEEVMFDMVKSTLKQYPEMLENVKRTSLYHGLLEWGGWQEEDENSPKTAA